MSIYNEHYTDEEIEVVADITTKISPWMKMGFALEITQAGLAHDYVTDLTLRSAIDRWFKAHGVLSLTLEEYLLICGHIKDTSAREKRKQRSNLDQLRILGLTWTMNASAASSNADGTTYPSISSTSSTTTSTGEDIGSS